MSLTKRQQAIEAAREHSLVAAEREAHLINEGWGCWRAFRATLPFRKWVRGSNGWHSFDPTIEKQIQKARSERRAA